MKVPLIAAVNGPCITGGMEIALQCDLIIASTSAIFRSGQQENRPRRYPEPDCNILNPMLFVPSEAI